MSDITRGLDRIEAVFDEESLVADAGLLLAGSLAARLGLGSLIDEVVRTPRSGRGSGAKVLTAVCSMMVGGSFFADADRLRAASTRSVLGFVPVAPSTLGTFARSFTWGHVRQLDRAAELALGRAWDAGAAPAAEQITIDVDSTIREVHSDAKHGAAYGHTRTLGYHPLVAVRDDTGEILHSRMRKGSSQKGHVRFIAETVAKMGRLAAGADLTLRADAGFFSWDLTDKLDELDVRFLVAVGRNPAVDKAIAAIGETDWEPIGYTDDGEAQVAETTLTSSRRPRGKPQRTVRLVVRRTRIVGEQADLFPNWRHHAVATDIDADTLDTKTADTRYRSHARVELAVKDLKAGGLAHSPSGRFAANAAWLACAALAHNIARWTARIAHVHDPQKLTVAATIARRLLTMPGRLVNRSGRPTLRLPARWPWAATFTAALDKIRCLPQHC